MKDFAPEYDRNELGWFEFPGDAEYRKRIFPPEVSKHPAKANIYLIQSIVEYVSEPEQIILDPMSGTGTLMIAALMGRVVICVDISELFHNIQQRALTKLDEIAPGINSHIMLINLPCQNYLPIPGLADHIIFSPPYANIFNKPSVTSGLDKYKWGLSGTVEEYSKNPLNLSLMNDFIWAQEMEGIYRKCYHTLKPNSTMTIITKDHIEKDQKTEVRNRVQLSKAARDACIRVGFTEKNWFKWKPHGSMYTGIYKGRGWEVVEDEDIIIMQKGEF